MDQVLASAASAVVALSSPHALLMLVAGVVVGLVVGIVPGLGGIVGLSLVLPFTFGMDPHSAMAMMMGLAAAVSHGDVIPAILFGVPGTVGCQATVMDGYPMAKRGEAGRALGAAFSASLLGGLFGALVLAVVIPVIRPVILSFGTPELLAICVFGLTLVAVLSGNAPLKGLVAGSIGLLLAMIGTDPQSGTLRFTFDTFYLWEGLPIVPFALGLFAIPELCDMMINRANATGEKKMSSLRGQWQGCNDTFQHWFLVIRTAVLGVACSVVPGIGAPVIDWLAYAHAARTERGANLTFGKGDVRGVIGTESATNSREGGALIPTIAFGIPAHPSMAILLGAFLIQGIVPGPDMLSKHLDITYTIVWSLALANVLGTVICFAFANQFARIATIRYTIMVPIVLSLVFIGSFQGQHSWADIFTMLCIGIFGWLMKQASWPRAPLVLGFILGSLVERYTLISVTRYGWSWLTNWFVLLMFAVSGLGIMQQVISQVRAQAAIGGWRVQSARLSMQAVLALLAVLVFAASLVVEFQWAFSARLMPQIISSAGLVFSLWLSVSDLFLRRGPTPIGGTHAAELRAADLVTDYGALTRSAIYAGAARYFVWCVGIFAAGYLLGFLPALLVFMLLYMRVHGRETWLTTLLVTGATFVVLSVIFDLIVHESWPHSVIGDLIPALRANYPWF